MYRAFIVFHRWLALIVGVFIMAVALTGAAVVFEGPVRRASIPTIEPLGKAMSIDSLAAIAVAAVGGGQPVVVSFGDSPVQPYAFAVSGQPGGRVMVNQYSGAVIPSGAGPTFGETFVQTAHRWHTRLTGGRIGEALVAIATISAFILALTGLVLWWREKIWRVMVSASWKRVNFDLHHALGLFAAPAILIMTLTGIWMVAATWITPLVASLNRSPPLPPLPTVIHSRDSRPVSLDSIVELARTSLPGAALVNVQVQKNSMVRAQMKYPEDHTPAGRSYVFIDQDLGAVLRVVSTRTAEVGTRLINLQRSLHTGDVLGLPTQVVWFLSILVLASQGVTGAVMWWNGRNRGKPARVVINPAQGGAN